MSNWITAFNQIAELEPLARQGKLAPDDCTYVIKWYDDAEKGHTQVLDGKDIARVGKLHKEFCQPRRMLCHHCLTKEGFTVNQRTQYFYQQPCEICKSDVNPSTDVSGLPKKLMENT